MFDVCFGIPSREVCRQLHVKLGMSKHESRHDKLKMLMLQVFVFLFLLLLGRLYQLFARKPWLTVYRAHTGLSIIWLFLLSLTRFGCAVADSELERL